MVFPIVYIVVFMMATVVGRIHRLSRVQMQRKDPAETPHYFYFLDSYSFRSGPGDEAAGAEVLAYGKKRFEEFTRRAGDEAERELAARKIRRGGSSVV